VGVLTSLKGIHHLINAFSLIAEEFPNAKLLIIGKEENRGYAVGLHEQVRKLGLENRIQFIAPQPQSELAIRMAKASVLVLPSLSEGFGRVIIEAMATGIPVIGSRTGGIPELIEDGTNGFLVRPGDEKTLAEKLHWVLSNPTKAEEMGAIGRAFVERCFSTANYLKGYEQTFEMTHLRMVHPTDAASPL
jgi:glycosyltransferase involved in cell wall biosynthesis